MTTYNYADVLGKKMFYREAGDENARTIVLLHGFPTSSHMYRNLIPLLAKNFHVIAPDYIGFGYSDAPNAADFTYTFDNEYFRTSQPRTLILWGKNDPFFTIEGAKAYQRDLPKAELHLLDTGHFALEEEGDFIAERIKAFLS